MIGLIDGAENGKPFWSDKVKAIPACRLCLAADNHALRQQHYFKVQAYRVETHAPNSYLAVDGEWFPFEPYHVEVHPKIATWLTPYGAYNANFTAPRT